MPLFSENSEELIAYDEAREALLTTLAHSNLDPLVSNNFLEQINQSKELSNFSLGALTRLLLEINQLILTPTSTDPVDCMRYYQTRMALHDTVLKQERSTVRGAGTSILTQIVNLKGTPEFPLALLSPVLAIINEEIKAHTKTDNELVSLIQYYQARLVLQETLSKQLVDQLHKNIGELLLLQIEHLKKDSYLSLDELTASLEVVNQIINGQISINDDPVDSLHYEQARLKLRKTLTDPKTPAIFISSGQRVLAKTEAVKDDVQRTTLLADLTEVLKLANDEIECPNIENAQAGLQHCSKIAPATHRELHAAFLGLIGVVILAVSVSSALGSFGVASPVSLMLFAMGLTVIAQAASIGAGIVGAGMIGRSLFSLFKPKPLPEQLKREMAHLSKDVCSVAAG